MFSTDFIFRQQENLVDNQKCQAGFRPLCNKILFLSRWNLTKKSRFAEPDFFIGFEIDLDFSRPIFSEIRVHIKRLNVLYYGGYIWKGVFSKPSGDYIVASIFCLLS
jgi:hypothetical protein